MSLQETLIGLLEGGHGWRDEFHTLVDGASSPRNSALHTTVCALKALVLLDKQYPVMRDHELQSIAKALAEQGELAFVCKYLPETSSAQIHGSLM